MPRPESALTDPSTDTPRWEELLEVVPRFVDRSRSQAEFARMLVGVVSCRLGRARRGSSEQIPAAPVPEHEQVDVLSMLVDDEVPDPPSVSAPSVSAPSVLTTSPEAAPGVDSAPTSDPESRSLTSESSLPIQDYDSLAASQVVPRLATLSPDDLRAVQAYEAATRHRQTILNRVAQLLADT
jgi:hypothetical protein